MHLNRKYTLNENYFDKIDSEDKSYFLGLMYADGCNYSNGSCFRINLQAKDKHILDTFKIYLGSNQPFSIIFKDNENQQDRYSLHISSVYMNSRLLKLGCLHQKSLILKFPTEEQVPAHLLKHFIRGYFDGDGGISIRPDKKAASQISFVGTKEFLSKLKNVLEQQINIHFTFVKLSKKNESNTYILITGGSRNSYKFLSWLYKDYNIKLRLERKYEKFLEIIEYIKYVENNTSHGKFLVKKFGKIDELEKIRLLGCKEK